ncbi:hypothetical protein GYMLUDRAFT_38163 [Collybiopsis luxurians FD-317 M1]|nr:hypothetical protein GYMLUDRAFT_38163 [Collybiopsis luxurians FD-317 M1]
MYYVTRRRLPRPLWPLRLCIGVSRILPMIFPMLICLRGSVRSNVQSPGFGTLVASSDMKFRDQKSKPLPLKNPSLSGRIQARTVGTV